METSGNTGKHRTTSGSKKRLPPVHIPLPFEKAVEGLLAVDPKKPIGKKPGKKPSRKK